MKLIQLTRGLVSKVDDCWFDFLNQFFWRALKIKKRYYAARSVWNPKTKNSDCILMHRLILNIPAHLQGDHKNGDSLDNQEDNIRILEPKQNAWAFQRKRAGTSVYRGVCWHLASRSWSAQLEEGGKKFHLGLFDTEREAALTRDAKARELGWPEEGMNFPITRPVLISS